MGRKKNKWFKKIILFYKYVFKFEVPYKIIVDGNMLAVSIQKKFDLKDYLTKLLDENVHLIIPSCILHEVKMLDKEVPGLLSAAMKYKVEECNHQVLTPDNCIKLYIGKRNFKKYFVATQDDFLRRQLRRIVATPLLFFDQNMMLIEKPPQVSMDAYHRVNFI